MLDFLMISTRSSKRGVIEIYPTFIIKKSSDLMIRGGDFYAIWIEELRVWSTDEQDAIQLIDAELDNYAKENADKFEDKVKVLHLWDSHSKMIDDWHKYCQRQMRDSYHMLDEKLIFSNDKVGKRDYSSKKLGYPLEPCEIPNYDHLMNVLYSPEERVKIEWAIGAVVNGDSKTIQKFMVLYGAAGTGKSTVLNIIQKLFDGYYSVFDAKALGSSSNSFALEAFKSNPLVAIQHDGDLSRIEDNTRLNSLVSHELMTVNEKFKATYTSKFKCFLFMGTNKPVKITDAKSGLLRRLIDVSPTGEKIPISEYRKIMKSIDFELGGIALHCKEVYEANPTRYDDYVPLNMMGASNDFYNYVLDSYFTFKKQDSVTLNQAWSMYKEYCDDAKVSYPLSRRQFKEELKNYFETFQDRAYIDDERIRSLYEGFKTKIFEDNKDVPKEEPVTAVSDLIEFKKQKSKFDEMCKDLPAQYGNKDDIPTYKWDNVKTKLSDLDTSKLHYVKLPINHIVIDFDIPDKDGKKDFEANLREASKWPKTYAELSKSGAGIHLHYIYKGDPEKLSRVYDEHIEIKVFNGKSSLRRKLTKCNDIPVATISSGLPLKGEKKMVNFEAVKSEKALRTLIKRNLNKEIHPGTKPSVDFIYKILEDAYNSDLRYDVSDMRNAILTFAANSTHQADYCMKLVAKMHFKSEKEIDGVSVDDREIVFYDIEVFPNLFLVNYKLQGVDKPVIRLINPDAKQIEKLMEYRLIGFNCRRYDNHILYGRWNGYNNTQLFNLSQNIVGKSTGFFREAYNISYTDIYDYCATKQSLKKWEIQLLNEADQPNSDLPKDLRDILKRIRHYELGLPWDQPVDESLWTKVAEYCDNDVLATEAVFMYTQGDFLAREILADLAGMTVNDTTNSLTTRIIFGRERHPKLVCTDLATGEQTDGSKPKKNNAFPGYEFKFDPKDKKFHNMYMGTDLGFGGYVYAQPGMYGYTKCYDVSGMHPASIRALNAFGDYTKNFGDIVDARLAIKHKDFAKAKTLFDGKLSKYLDDPAQAKSLAKALKIAVNSVYGLTSASFDNPFRDVRNKNNIVALRGALFMRLLQEKVTEMGYTVIHVKTDSMKIHQPDAKIEKFIMDFGKEYGYNFEIEHVFDRICLVNNAVYIGKLSDEDSEIIEAKEKGKTPQYWTATGTQFQIPYVFKTLFSKDPIIFDDLCEIKSVQKGALYLDMNENLPEGEHAYHFIGRVGLFTPVQSGIGGGELLRVDGDKYYSATGAKGYRWMESSMVKDLKKEKCVDKSYYDNLVNEAVDDISKYGDFEMFVSDTPLIISDPLPEFKKKEKKEDKTNE